MANETTFQTRIQLKYDSYANWTSNNPILLKGEIAITDIPADATDTDMTNLPCTAVKVGDGTSTYDELAFISSVAGDVAEITEEEIDELFA